MAFETNGVSQGIRIVSSRNKNPTDKKKAN